MKKIFGLTIIFLLFSSFQIVLGQILTLENNRSTAVISFTEKPLTNDEQAEFRIGANYKFYELIDPKGINIRAVPLDNISVNSINILQNGFRVNLNLNSSLEFGKIYLLKINKAMIAGKEVAVLRLELSKEPVLKVFNDPRNRIRLESNVELNETKVTVNETILKVSADKSILEIVPVPVSVETKLVTPTQMNIKFKKPLSETGGHYFKIDLEADDGTSLKAKGKVFVPGLQPLPPAPKIDVKLSSEFGGNLKPQFNLTGSIINNFYKSENELIYFEPVLSFDIGLGATKSKNNITLELPTFKYSFNFPRSSGCKIDTAPNLRSVPNESLENPKMTEGKRDTVLLPCYSAWSQRNLLTLYSVDLKAGPKFETDKKFSKVNALGSVQFALNFDRWQHSIANQRNYLEMDLKNTAYKGNVNDILIKTGFTLTPRIGFEFGRKLTTEIVANKSQTIRQVIPQNPIFRTYIGFIGIFEWNHRIFPIKLTVSEDLLFLALTETSSEIKSNMLDLRKVRGFHPLGKASLDIALDPAKRYNFNITYENGRAAPNFEYLNTVKTGFRINY